MTNRIDKNLRSWVHGLYSGWLFNPTAVFHNYFEMEYFYFDERGNRDPINLPQ